MATKQLAVIVGAGPGTGAAVGSAFARKGYNVALLARSADKLAGVVEKIGKSEGHVVPYVAPFVVDVASEKSVKDAFAGIKATFPGSPLKVAVFNSSGPFLAAPFLETKASQLENSLSVSVLGAFHFAQAAIPELLVGSGGSLILTGATASLRGSAKLGTFAAGKFGLRALGQSLAREFGPQGIHVAHVIVDGVIESERVIELIGPAKTPDSRISAESIADAYVYLHEQDRTAWTQELDLRPSVEKF